VAAKSMFPQEKFGSATKASVFGSFFSSSLGFASLLSSYLSF